MEWKEGEVDLAAPPAAQNAAINAPSSSARPRVCVCVCVPGGPARQPYASLLTMGRPDSMGGNQGGERERGRVLLRRGALKEERGGKSSVVVGRDEVPKIGFSPREALHLIPLLSPGWQYRLGLHVVPSTTYSICLTSPHLRLFP